MKFLNNISSKLNSIPGALSAALVSLPLLSGCGMDNAQPEPADQGSAAPQRLLSTVTTLPTLTAASCQFSAVQATVAGATAGQTVMIPAGTCDWGSSQLIVPAGITLKGAGRDATVLRRTSAVSGNTYLVRYDCYNGRQARISDMTFVGANLMYSSDRGLGLIGGCVDFRVYNMKFTKFVFAGVEVRGPSKQRGVIHGNQFINNYNDMVGNYGYGIVVFGDGTWPALELGTANAVFVENNYMYGNRHQIAANNGSRYVFRYNTAVANDLTRNFPQVDAHGLSGSPRGTRSWEVYNNTFSAELSTGNRAYAGVGMRGGDGVIFNNTYSSNIISPVALILEEEPCGSYPVMDQVRQAYISETVPVTSHCELSIARNRDYFLSTKAGYTPYPYPHPLRAG